MLANAFAQATIPAEDLNRAAQFYTDILGLKKVSEPSEYYAVFEAGRGTQILIYQRGRTTAEHTAITFIVDDLDAVINELAGKGITPEHYEMGPIKTDERGIAHMDGYRMAWITDPEGNILALSAQ